MTKAMVSKKKIKMINQSSVMINTTKKPAMAGVGIRGRKSKAKERYSNSKWMNIHIRRQLQE